MILLLPNSYVWKGIIEWGGDFQELNSLHCPNVYLNSRNMCQTDKFYQLKVMC